MNGEPPKNAKGHFMNWRANNCSRILGGKRENEDYSTVHYSTVQGTKLALLYLVPTT